MKRVCQYCARYYEPATSMAPKGFCCQACANIGETPYNKASISRQTREKDVESFSKKLIDHVHYALHNGDNRLFCSKEECVQARILGL